MIAALLAKDYASFAVNFTHSVRVSVKVIEEKGCRRAVSSGFFLVL